MSASVTVLVDNVEGPGCGAQWGYSLAVRTRGDNLWIWDTGCDDLFVRNVRTLGIDLSMATGMALSHGHYDHGGGIPALLETGFKGSIHAHPQVTRQRFSVRDGKAESIGLPHPMPEFDAVNDYRDLDEGLEMITDIKRRPGFAQAIDGFFFDREGTRPDPVADDAFLLLDTTQGPVVLLGCCHSGLENTLFQLRDVTGLERVHAVVGGMHLYNQGQRQIDDCVRVLKKFDVELVATAHCTGEEAAEKLRQQLPCEVCTLQSGATLHF